LQKSKCFLMNASVSSLDARSADGRYIMLMGPLLQPDRHENKTSLDRAELTDKFPSARISGRRPVSRGPGAVAVINLVVVPGENGRRLTRHHPRTTVSRYSSPLGADRGPELRPRAEVDPCCPSRQSALWHQNSPIAEVISAHSNALPGIEMRRLRATGISSHATPRACPCGSKPRSSWRKDLRCDCA